MVETILSALAPIVVTLLLGFVAAWHQDFGTKDASVLDRMVLLYAVPIALFVGTVGTPRRDLVQDVAFAVAMCVAIVGTYTLVFLFFRFMLRFSLSESVLAALAASAPAAPFMGPAILGDLLGKASAVSIAIRISRYQPCSGAGHNFRSRAGENAHRIDGASNGAQLGFVGKASGKEPIVWARKAKSAPPT